jgi:hypothetical protein
MEDPYFGTHKAISDPAERHYTISPSDTEDLPFRPRGIFVLTAGNVVLRDMANVEISYPVTVGMQLPFRPIRVMATGTDATMVAWY